MKKIIIVGLIAVALASCKKDNTSTAPTATSIVGKWNYSKERTQVLSPTGAVVSDQTTTSFTADDYVQYNADGTGVASAAGGGIVDFSYSLSGNTDTEYQTPKFVGETPYVFIITLAAASLTRHSETTANGETTIIDDDFTK
jgi:hypothetical protein